MGLKRFLADLLGLRPRRMQVAALCLRGEGNAREVLLVTSRDSGRWLLPKGWPVAGRDLAGSAQQEAWEEAGVRGEVERRPVGRFHGFKGGPGGLREEVTVLVFRIHSPRQSAEFPEAGQRRIGWFALDAAAAMVDESGLADFLRGLHGRGEQEKK